MNFKTPPIYTRVRHRVFYIYITYYNLINELYMIFNDIVELKCVSQSTHSLRTFEYFFSFE